MPNPASDASDALAALAQPSRLECVDGLPDTPFVSKAGELCVYVNNASLYFKAGDSDDVGDADGPGWSDSATALNLKIAIHYFDKGTETIRIGYTTNGTTQTNTTIVTKENTKRWRKATLIVTDALFGTSYYGIDEDEVVGGGGDHFNADFRIFSSGDLYLGSIAITNRDTKAAVRFPAYDFVNQTNTVPPDSLTGDSLQDATITADQIANATITASQIANATITATQIANATITGTQIASATIQGSNIASATITGANIASASITGTNIASATITATQIANGTITATQIASGTITANEIQNATITGGKIASATITGSNIAAGTILAANIASGTITGTQIASSTITATNIQSLTITATEIADLTITAGKISNATITGAKIASATITDSNIAASTITGGKIAAGTITAGNIQSGTITGGLIAAGTITAANLAANTITSQQLYLGAYGGIPYNVGEALLLAHFDGARPYETNYTGNLNGHRGQVGTVTGGVIFRPGKFGKGVQIAEATTNRVLNPSAETTGNFSAQGSATVSLETAHYYYGGASFKVVTSSAAFDGINLTLASCANASHYLSFWVKGTIPTGSNWAAVIGGGSAVTLTKLAEDGDWSRWGCQFSASDSNGATNVRIRQGDAVARTFYIDGVQVEQKIGPTPYCDGTLGGGHSWGGTAHASTSARTAATLTYPALNVDLSRGTVALWAYIQPVTPATTFARAIGLRVDANNFLVINLDNSGVQTPYASNTSGGSNVSTVTGAATAGMGWHHIAVTWQAGALKLYLDGAQSGATAAYVAPVGTLTNIEIGAFNASGMCNTVIDDVVILPNVLTATEIRAIYDSNAPVIAEGSIGEWRVTNGAAEVWGNANGLFGRNASGVASFALLNADGVNSNLWGGASETFDSGDAMLGSNASGKSNAFWDASTGRLNFRGGTTTRAYVDTNGDIILSGETTPVSGYLKWKLGTGETIAILAAGHSASASSGPQLIGRAKSSSESGIVTLWAQKHDESASTLAQLFSTGSFLVDLRNGSNTSAGAQALNIAGKTSTTNAQTTLGYFDAYSSGTAAAKFGVALALRAQDNGGTLRDQAFIGSNWDVATSGSRRSRLNAGLYNVASSNTVLSVPYFARIPSIYRKDTSGGTTVQNTTTETEIFSQTIEANELASNGILTLDMGGDLQQNSGGTINLTFRVKFGGSTINTYRVAVQTFSGTGGWHLRCTLVEANATNAQRAWGSVVAGRTTVFADSGTDYGGLTIDTTADRALSVTAQWASAHSSAGVFSKGGVVLLAPS